MELQILSNNMEVTQRLRDYVEKKTCLLYTSDAADE